MYLSVHGVTGLVIGRLIPNPLVAFLAGLISHFALDLIPHGDEHLVDEKRFTRPRILRRILGASLLDGIVLLVLTVVYFATTPFAPVTATMAAIAGALLPDVLHGIHLLTHTKSLDWFVKFHSRLHNLPGQKFRWQVGILIQVLVLTAMWLLVVM